MPTIYSWHPVLTPHQAHTLHALGLAMGSPVRVVTASREHSLRKTQGWAANDDSLITPEILPERGWRKRISAILDADPSAIHMFGSPFERSQINFALFGAAARRRSVILISEPYSPRGVGYLKDGARLYDMLKARLRPVVYEVYGRLLRKRVAGVFAISPLAIQQYRAMGIEKIFPFGYFVPGDGAIASVGNDKGLKVAFLGSFIARKGIASLQRAFRSENVLASGARLTMFGAYGDAKRELSASNIDYGGTLPFAQVQQTLAGFDLLVVPSLFDGWAVVVNEAIQAGVPVLASGEVGAGAMISRWNCGGRFAAGNVADLASAIVAIANDRATLMKWREGARALSPMLEPGVAGDYMARCIGSMLDGSTPPDAPWY